MQSKWLTVFGVLLGLLSLSLGADLRRRYARSDVATAHDPDGKFWGLFPDFFYPPPPPPPPFYPPHVVEVPVPVPGPPIPVPVPVPYPPPPPPFYYDVNEEAPAKAPAKARARVVRNKH